jgi:hypothetical protein
LRTGSVPRGSAGQASGAPASLASPGRPINLAIIPSVSGGLGHVTRSAKLARALERAEPSLRISYVLDELGLRPFNLQAVEQTGYPVQMLPNVAHRERNEAIRSVLGQVDVVIEDTRPRLIPYRRILPRLKVWISVPMLPLWDELFMSWPLFEHVDHMLYTYPPIMPVPEELEPFRHKITVTGPILDPDEMPSRAIARRRLKLIDERRYITYAPRGFPFGKRFGRRVLNAVVGGFVQLREQQPGLRLVLTAVPDPSAIQPKNLPPLDQIPGLTVERLLPPEQARDYLAASDLAIVEGTSTLFDAAVARTPVLMVPGPIHETLLEARWVKEHMAGVVMRAEEVSPASMALEMREALEPRAAADRAARLNKLVGASGRERAVETVLRVIAEKVLA